MVLATDPLRLERGMERTASVDEVLLLLERFAPDAIPALVHTFVDVAGVENAPGDLDDPGLVARLGRANEVVERDVQAAPGVAELALHLIAVGQRVESLLDRRLEHVLRVLVVSHQEPGLDP